MHSTLLQSSQDSPDWVIKCAIRDFCQPEFIMAAPWADIGRRFHLIIYIHMYVYMYIHMYCQYTLIIYDTVLVIFQCILFILIIIIIFSIDCSKFRNSLIQLALKFG